MPIARPGPIALLPLLVALGCSGAQATNMLADPGFEEGGDAWRRHRGALDFEVAEAPVRSGERAMRVRLDHEAPPRGRTLRVLGASQELTAASVPERVGGHYRVERWESGSPDTALYVQLVVSVWGDSRTPELVGNERARNHQLRYFLAGVDEPPYDIDNARQTVVSAEPPETGVWVPFELPVRADFERLWGEVPETFSKLTVFFEARWDRRPPGAVVDADVYFDDLYAIP